MAANDRIPDDYLINQLESTFRKYHFFQFYRLLRTQVQASQIEFLAVNQYHFSTSDIRAFQWDPLRERWTVETTAFGLFSSAAFLPTSFPEIFESYGKVQRHASQAFLSNFETRIVNLFYDSKATYDAALIERPEDHAWVDAVGALLHSASDNRDLQLAWFDSLGRVNRSVSSFEWICSRVIPFTATVRSLHGGYLDAPEDMRAQLGPRGFYKTLGPRIWLQDAVLDILVRDIEVLDVLRFLPDGDLHREVMTIARKLFGQLPRLSFDVSLAHDAQLPSHLGLGSDDYVLGRTTFISGRSLDRRAIQVQAVMS